MSTAGRVLVFAKAPVAGHVKTRLIAALGAEGAAALHARLLRHTLATVCAARDAVELWCAPDTHHPCFAQLADEFPLVLRPQRGAGLGARMAHAFDVALRDAPAAVIVGSDCPGLTRDDLDAAFAALARGCDAVLGPATDGGYWLIGLRRAAPALFEDMRWGGAEVLDETLARLRGLGWNYTLLAARADVDRPEDLAHLPAALRPAPMSGA